MTQFNTNSASPALLKLTSLIDENGAFGRHSLGLPQNTISRDVCKSRIHDRRDYRDFRLVSWFSAIAVILCHGHDYHQNMYNFNFQTVNLSKYLCRISFLGAGSLINNLLHGREYVHTERRPHVRLHSSYLDQTDSDTASDTGAYDRKHAVGQPCIRSSGKSVHSVSQSIKPINSSVGVSYKNTELQIL